MMILSDLREAVDFVGLLCDRINGLPVNAQTLAAADLRRATGALRVDAETLLRSLGYGPRAAACFELASAAGVTVAGFHRLWLRLSSPQLTGPYGRVVQQDACRRAIVGMAEGVAATTFASRDAVSAAQSQINAVFGVAEEEAADALDAEVYRALVTLHASVTQDLNTRARPLPRMTSYETAVALPALVLAQRLYGDAGRAEELIGENPGGAPHPLFMPLVGRALSA